LSTLPHYNNILKDLWTSTTYSDSVIFQPSALQIPYNEKTGWPIKLPDLPENYQNKEFAMVIHFQDSLTYDDQSGCIELQKVENYYPKELHTNIVVVVEDISLEKTYSGDLHVVWFPTFLYEIAQQMLKIKDKWDHYIDCEPTKNWQCLNGIPKRWRKQLANYLHNNFENGILSLANIIPLQSHAYDDVYHGKGNDNPENFLMLDWVYKDCALNIVSETIYDNDIGILTEKTLFAFLAGQIPLVIAHRGFVTELIEMGFDMFTDVVDTSYDRLPDNQRWQAAVDRNRNLINSGLKRQPYIERLKRNKEFVLHEFGTRCIDRYIKQMHSFNIDFSTARENFPSLDTSGPS